ncbi:MAG: transporter substrate-binding domain-containing protein [Caldilineaceae bacterium]
MSNFYRHPHLPIVQAGAHRLRLPLCLMLLLSLLLQPAASPVQAQIGATRGTAIIGVSAFSAPFASQSTNGQMVGFDLELMKTLVRTAGLRVSYEAVPFRELIPGVATQLYDAAAGCIFVTEARKALVDFTVPYFTTGTILLFSDATAPLYTVTDLTAEMRVAVSSGSTAERFLREQTAVQVVEALEQQAALDLLVRGAAEAALIDETVAVRFLRSNLDTRLKMMGGLITTDECAFAVSKANPRLRLELNAALTRLKNNGQFLTIYRRWFGSRP